MTPQPLGLLASDSTTVAGVVGGDTGGVEPGGDGRAALASAHQALVDVTHEIGRREPLPDLGLVRDQMRGLLAASDAVSNWHDAPAVAALSCGSVHAVGAAAGELTTVVVGHHGLDVVAEKVGLA